MRGVARLRDGGYILLREQPRERELRRSDACALRERTQPAVPEEPAFVERRVRHHRDAVAAAQRQKVPLDAAAAQVIEHLIRRAVPAPGNLQQLLHVGAIEIGYAPVANATV